MKNVFGILWSEHRLVACAPSPESFRGCVPNSAEYNSAGRTDLEVDVPQPHTAERMIVGQAHRLPRRLGGQASSLSRTAGILSVTGRTRCGEPVGLPRNQRLGACAPR